MTKGRHLAWLMLPMTYPDSYRVRSSRWRPGRIPEGRCGQM